MVPIFKTTPLMFLEILFIQYFTIFSCKQYDVITNLICIIEKHQYPLRHISPTFYLALMPSLLATKVGARLELYSFYCNIVNRRNGYET